MSKSAKKSKTIIPRNRNNQNGISFNNQSFFIGNKHIIIDLLSKPVYKYLLNLYKSKQLEKSLYKGRNPYQKDNYKYEILTQNEAVMIIWETEMRKYQKYIGRMMNVALSQASQQSYIPQYLSGIAEQNKFPVKQIINQLQTPPSLTANPDMQIFKQQSVNLQKRLFLESIVMIIQKPSSKHSSVQQNKKVIVVMQQCYPTTKSTKLQLINLIGQQKYEQKLQKTLKLYNYAITHKQFKNSEYVTCHSCMRVIMDAGYPVSLLRCKNKVEEKCLQRQHSISCNPYRYLTKIINKQHFSQWSAESSLAYHPHPYIRNYLLPKSSSQPTSNNQPQKYECERHLCQGCYFKIKSQLDKSTTKNCNFCQLACQCFRCKMFYKLNKLIAWYLKQGGNMQQLQRQFIWNTLYKVNENRSFDNSDNSINNNNNRLKNDGLCIQSQIFRYRSQLRAMCERYEKTLTSMMVVDKQLSDKQLIALFTYTLPIDGQHMPKPLQHHHKPKPRLPKTQSVQARYLKLQQKKRQYQQLHQATKQTNNFIKVQQMPQEKIQKFDNLHTIQLNKYLKYLQRQKILKQTDPQVSYRMRGGMKRDVIIYQQSRWRKQQNQFMQNLGVGENNPFSMIKQQRSYLRVKRLQTEQSSQVKRLNNDGENVVNLDGQQQLIQLQQQHKQQKLSSSATMNRLLLERKNYNGQSIRRDIPIQSIRCQQKQTVNKQSQQNVNNYGGIWQ